MTAFSVSPKYTSDYLVGADLSKKIDVFEDQMRGWHLDHAETLARSQSQHAGFAILTLVIVYVEAIACFVEGRTSNKESNKFFSIGMNEIFPDFEVKTVDAFRKEFYRQVRCGQLHQGLVRANVCIVRGADAAVVVIDGTVRIDPWLFLENVHRHFREYIERLRDPQEAKLRANFETWFDARHA